MKHKSALFILAAIGAILASCQTTDPRTKESREEAELRFACIRFMDDTVDKVEELAKKRGTDRAKRFVEDAKRFRAKQERATGRELLLDNWSLWRRLSEFANSDKARKAFGDGAKDVQELANERLGAIREIGRQFLDPDRLKTVQETINQHAKDNPYQFERRSLGSDFTESSSRAVKAVIDIPLSPFRALSGVGRGGRGIEDLSLTARDAVRVIDRLPSESRKQLQIILKELEKNAVLVKNTESFKSVAESAVQISKTAQDLPENLRKQTQILLRDASKEQPELRKTLASIESMGKTYQATVVDVRKAAKELDTAAKDISQLSRDIENMVRYFQGEPKLGEKKTSKNVSDTEGADSKGRPEPTQKRPDAKGSPEPTQKRPDAKENAPEGDQTTEPDEDGFEFKDIENGAKALADASREIRKLLADVEKVANSRPFDEQVKEINALADKKVELVAGVVDAKLTQVDTLATQRLEQVDTLAAQRLEQANSRMKELVDQVFWRSLVLLGVFFCLLVAARVIGEKLKARRRREGN